MDGGRVTLQSSAAQAAAPCCVLTSSAELACTAGGAVRPGAQRTVGQEERGVQLRCAGGLRGGSGVLTGVLRPAGWAETRHRHHPSWRILQLISVGLFPTPPLDLLSGIFRLNNHSDWRVWRNSLPDNQVGLGLGLGRPWEVHSASLGLPQPPHSPPAPLPPPQSNHTAARLHVNPSLRRAARPCTPHHQ